jgi:hypothetical protein
MVELEDQQEREAQEKAVGCYGLYGIQYSPPAHHSQLENSQFQSTPPKNKTGKER